MMNTYQIQCLLSFLGYTIIIDGVPGQQTKSAVRAFQKDYGLSADGIAGVATQKALRGAVAGTMEPVKGKDTNAPTTSGSGGGIYGSKWFRRAEFACKCGSTYCDGFPHEPEEKLVRILNDVREHFNAPVTITSGLRCDAHNRAVGGVANSKHLFGKAADIVVRGFSGEMVLAYVKALPAVNYTYHIPNSEAVHIDIA